MSASCLIITAIVGFHDDVEASYIIHFFASTVTYISMMIHSLLVIRIHRKLGMTAWINVRKSLAYITIAAFVLYIPSMYFWYLAHEWRPALLQYIGVLSTIAFQMTLAVDMKEFQVTVVSPVSGCTSHADIAKGQTNCDHNTSIFDAEMSSVHG